MLLNGFLRAAVFALLAVVLCLSLPASGQTTEEKRLAAVDLGIEHLVKRLDSGQLGGNYYGYIRCNDHALVGLALLCHGSGYESGPYHDRHRKILDYLKQNRFAGREVQHYYLGVWGHGYMLWYLSELAETASAENREELDRFALQLIAELTSWQSEAGGWGHHPELLPTDSGYTEFSVITSLSLCSLLRARERGYHVDPKVISRGFDYLDSTVTGRAGAPRYAADENIGAGNQREGAPRGALVMLPYALDKRTTPAVRRLLSYLKQCEDFTGGHASASLGMCHSALLFATIDEYGHFWKLHGEGILGRQKSDGSFNALPPGERTNEERAGDLSDAFHTLTLALPEAPWKWRQKALPETSRYSMHAMIRRAQALAEEGDTYPSIQALAELDPADRKPADLNRQVTNHLRKALNESKEDPDSGWLVAILEPYAACQITSADDKNIGLLITVAPMPLRGIKAEARVVTGEEGRAVQTIKLKPEETEMSTKSVKLRTSKIDNPRDLSMQIDWTWNRKAFTTTHPLLTASGEE